MVYLRCVLNADGNAGTELSRRLGSAREEFCNLQRIWNHSSISRSRKLEVYNACVVSKLTYNLHSLWLNKNEQGKIDALHVRCLRKVLKIAPSYYSRVSNQTVLQQAGARSISNQLLERQLLFLGDLARRENSDILKQSVLDTSTQGFAPKANTGHRRRGRPKTTWSKGVFAQAVKVAAHSSQDIGYLMMNSPAARTKWSQVVRKYCNE